MNNNLEILYKWGCDRSNGQSQYKLNFQQTSDNTDHDLFMFSLVHIQLRLLLDDESKIILQNPRPSSTRFCCSIKFLFQEETTQSTREKLSLLISKVLYVNYCKCR